MKESFFKFSDPYILSLKYEDNLDFKPEKFENIKIDFNNKIEKNDDNKALVTVNMEIGNMIDCPFHISLSIQAFFYWNECNDETLINNLLEKNAVSLLIGYIRPIVASITSSSRYPTFNLPFINLADEE